MPMQTLKPAVALVTLMACASAPAAMYRWVDENGMTVYSQTPPLSGDAVKLKKQPAPGADEANAARERLRRQRERAFDEDEARKEAEIEQAKKTADEQRRAANCASARKNLEGFQNLGPRMVQTPDGRYLRLSEEQVQTQIEKAQGQVKEYCDEFDGDR